MNKSQMSFKKLNSFISIALLTIFNFACSCEIYHFEYDIKTTYLWAVVWAILLVEFDTRLKVSAKLIFIEIFILCAIIMLYIYDINIIGDAKDFGIWFYDYARGATVKIDEYVVLSKAIAFFIISIIINLMQKRLVLKAFCAELVIGCLVFCGIWKYEISKLLISIALFYVISVVIEIGLYFSNKKILEEYRIKTTVRFFPVIILIVYATSLVPYSSEPLKWEKTKVYVNNATDNFAELTKNIHFGLSIGKAKNDKVGFSDNTAIGGDVNLGNQLVMTVKFDKKPKRNVYLTGSVSNVYDGQSWSKIANEKDYGIDNYALDYVETYYALLRNGFLPENNDVGQFLDANVKYEKLNTDNVFYPLKTTKSIKDNGNNVTSRDGNLYFDKTDRKKTDYNFSFLSIDQSDAIVRNILSNPEFYNRRGELSLEYPQYKNKEIEVYENVGAVAVLDQKLIEDFKVNREKLPDDYYFLFFERAREIKENYRILPENLPTRVTDLAENIVTAANATSEYEKLKAIESYLKTYTYTTTPGEIPEGRDAVDYFLFDTKKGYCTYFASAMAVMARSVGIPTRFVRGYIVDTSKTTKDNTYKVESKNAHAWVEGYIDGVGWIPFEPTSGYSNFSDAIPEEQLSLTSKTDSSSRPEFSSRIVESSTKDDSTLSSSKKDKNIVNGDTENIPALSLIIIIAVIAILVLIPFIIWLYVNNIFKGYRKRYANADTNDKLFMDFNIIIAILEKQKLKIAQGETLLEFVIRANNMVKVGNMSFFEVANIFMKARYGDVQITENEVNNVQVFRESLENNLKENISSLGYFNFKLNASKNKKVK